MRSTPRQYRSTTARMSRSARRRSTASTAAQSALPFADGVRTGQPGGRDRDGHDEPARPAQRARNDARRRAEGHVHIAAPRPGRRPGGPAPGRAGLLVRGRPGGGVAERALTGVWLTERGVWVIRGAPGLRQAIELQTRTKVLGPFPGDMRGAAIAVQEERRPQRMPM